MAQAAGCDAIHPGYGFLSENADFADACEAAGITFIGPSGDVIRAMGNKAAARKLMQSAGVPVVPGSDGAVDTAEQARALADSIGYPVLIKASAGGGGRGMRRVYEPEQLIPLFEEARSESLACFGSGEMYLEKLIVNPRHIEFQIMADGQGHVIQLGDRDCSIQRRNQKLLEESPSKALTPELRELIERTREISRHYEGCQVNICLNYGGRDEILRAARDFARDCAQGKADPDSLTEEQFSEKLFSKGVPDPDLIIRPSGELRLSNFLLWQAAYAEFYFTDVLWPDFSNEELLRAIADFQSLSLIHI